MSARDNPLNIKMMNWFLFDIQQDGMAKETKTLMNNYMNRYPNRIRHMPARAAVTSILRGDSRFAKDDSSKRVKWYVSEDGNKWLEEISRLPAEE